MRRYHGGDWKSYEEIYGELPLDFSASVSPLGMPEAAREAAAAALADCARYPDPRCRVLRQALAEHTGIPAERILCGSGASDLILRLALAQRPNRALLTAPTYGEYRQALEQTGCHVREHPLLPSDAFRLTDAFLAAITPDLDVVLLCEPGNPTGLTTERALLGRIAARCDEYNILLVIDECFMDFLEDAHAHSLRQEIGRHHLLVINAFTKFYGMAGLRLGWCACGDPDLLSRMEAAGSPWPVSAPAMAAGTAALKDDEYAKRLRALIRRERDRLAAALQASGCRVLPGEANYLLFYDPLPDLVKKMARRGILLRDCSSFSGLGPGWIRTAVRLPEENDRLIQTMEALHL